jgi:DNA-binding NarL/FixJ family response regulator
MGEMGEPSVLKGLVCSADTLVRQTMSATVVKADYELVGETDDGPSTIELSRMVKPDLLVIDNDLPWRPGVEWVADLAADHPLAAILLLANDQGIRERAVECGAFGVVYRNNLSELSGALGRARAWLEDPERRKLGERRTGRDRRQRQEWAKVTTERRSGGDRRSDPAGGAASGP